ncbi:hypothetical protein GCM10011579_060840 [Streptomyces albiflavescens]|uniref:FXSXX-COOH protein n=2 Tax=Streptomyces albiflavescens TaxID=1623582 RepID=A0A917YAP5_9ACTN|nr:hypothetical protein GCM10011579_060840 [Streptomyces albiflavescens]
MRERLPGGRRGGVRERLSGWCRSGAREEGEDMGARDDALDSDVAAERLRDLPDAQILPDLLELDLADLRTIQHPVLTEVLEELRERAGQPSEMLWGFNNAF